MIKRILAALLTLVFMLSGFAAYAKEVPLPEANTDAEVLLPGFDWYCDYEALIKAAEANGLPTDPGSRVNMVGSGASISPHWDIYRNDSAYLSASEKDCGGSILFNNIDFELFGHSADQCMMHIYVEPGFEIDRYRESGAARLYLAEFWIHAGDSSEVYDDLLNKLKALYGENPMVDETGACWINEEGAMVGLTEKIVVGSPSYNHVRLTMMAPGAEERLNEVVKMRNSVAPENTDKAKLEALANTFANAYFAGRADVVAGMLTEPYPYPRDLFYAGQVSSFRLKGLDHVADEEEIGARRTIVAEFVNPHTQDSFFYLDMEFIKESDNQDGWKVQFFGIDA